ncbi:MAG: hypothetical protein GF331_02395 [Chitinivibrionales bacterium]|nr:hypothetical protein [Chitinivibrionales bacterium]
MAKPLSLGDILALAIQIETNGIELYRRAAQNHRSDDEAQVLLSLATMEQDHRERFEQLRREVQHTDSARASSHRPSDYIVGLADAHGGEGDPIVADTLSGDETLEEIAHTAVELEEQSIRFYSDLAELFDSDTDRAVIAEIIDEERGHVLALRRWTAE